MTKEELENKLKLLKIEDIIWGIYFVLIVLSLYSNEFERDYLINKNNVSKEIYRKINIAIFTILLLIYIYFTYENYNDIKNLKETDSENKIKFTYISFIGTILVLISGILFLYIAYYDKEIETEIAFN